MIKQSRYKFKCISYSQHCLIVLYMYIYIYIYIYICICWYRFVSCWPSQANHAMHNYLQADITYLYIQRCISLYIYACGIYTHKRIPALIAWQQYVTPATFLQARPAAACNQLEPTVANKLYAPPRRACCNVTDSCAPCDFTWCGFITLSTWHNVLNAPRQSRSQLYLLCFAKFVLPDRVAIRIGAWRKNI